MPNKLEDKPFDIKAYILEAAKAGGMKEDAATAFSEKCYADFPMVMWQPYGGATSFDEIDLQKESQEYSFQVQMATDGLRGIINNVTDSEDLSVDEKAAAIAKAAADYRDRIKALKESDPDVGEVVDDLVGGTASRAIKAVKNFLAGNKGKQVAKLAINHGFKVFVDNEGNYRWLATSSNSFQDLDREIFRQKALEEAVDYANQSGEHGPLLVFHFKSVEIGDCDFQAMAGRFLLESGTFRESELGHKALDYFLENPEEEFQVSIGYQYKKGDEEDGVYDWTRITERSVLPKGTAANPFTEFSVIGDKAMHSQARETLVKMFGEEAADEAISALETKSKELEGTVAFKEMKEDEFGEITDIKEVTPVANAKAAEEASVVSHSHGNVEHTHRVKSESEHTHQGMNEAYKAAKKTPAADAEDKTDGGADEANEDANGNPKKKAPPFAKKEGEDAKSIDSGTLQVATALAEVLDAIHTLTPIISTLEGDVKELKKSDADRMAEALSPRWSFPGGVRPSEAESNVKEVEAGMLATEDNPQDVNPARAYVEDLIGRPARA